MEAWPEQSLTNTFSKTRSPLSLIPTSVLATCVEGKIHRHGVCQGSARPPQGSGFARIQRLVILMTRIYYSKGTQSKIRKEKGTWGKVGKKPDTGFQESPLPTESEKMHWVPLVISCDETCWVCSPGKHSTREAYQIPKILKLTETESRMAGARGWGWGNGKLLFSGCTVAIMQDK